MESIPNLWWSLTSKDRPAKVSRDRTETRVSRLSYKMVAALFIVFFVIDELLSRYRENKYGKYCPEKKKLSVKEIDSEI